MIADRHRVVAQVIHCQHHRVTRKRQTGKLKLQRQLARRDVLLVDTLQWRALDGISAIEKKCGRRSLSFRLNESCEFSESTRGGFAGEVVVRINVSVYVSSGKNRNRDLTSWKKAD